MRPGSLTVWRRAALVSQSLYISFSKYSRVISKEPDEWTIWDVVKVLSTFTVLSCRIIGNHWSLVSSKWWDLFTMKTNWITLLRNNKDILTLSPLLFWCRHQSARSKFDSNRVWCCAVLLTKGCHRWFEFPWNPASLEMKEERKHTHTHTLYRYVHNHLLQL